MDHSNVQTITMTSHDLEKLRLKAQNRKHWFKEAVDTIPNAYIKILWRRENRSDTKNNKIQSHPKNLSTEQARTGGERAVGNEGVCILENHEFKYTLETTSP